jgi:hypothetical protein
MRNRTINIILFCFVIFNIKASSLIDLTKKVTKTFPLSANTVIASGNIYGATNVIIRPGKEVTYDINIKVSAADNERAKQELDRISIEFSETPARVTGVTKIASKNSSWFNWGKNSNVKIDIIYNIYVPDNRSLALGQDYGNIKLPDYNGPVSIELDYGDLNGGDLSNNAVINVDYGDINLGRLNTVKFNIDYTDATIISANSADVNLDYGDFIATGAITDFTINTDYSEIEVDQVRTANIRGDYSHFDFRIANAISVNSDYGDCIIKDLKGNLTFSGDYSTAKVENVSSSSSNITLKGDYSNLKVGMIDGYNFSVEGDYINVTAPSKDKGKGIITGQKSGRTNTKILVQGDYNSLTIR